MMAATRTLAKIGIIISTSLVMPTLSKYFRIANPKYSCTRYKGYDIPAIHANPVPIGSRSPRILSGISILTPRVKQRNTAITTQ